MAQLKYYRDVPGLTQAQTSTAQKRIQAAAEEKERYATVDAPGDVTVRATSTLSLSGTGTAADMTYNVETVEHEFSADQGYRMKIVAKNMSGGS